jgi:hypothetical protein
MSAFCGHRRSGDTAGWHLGVYVYPEWAAAVFPNAPRQESCARARDLTGALQLTTLAGFGGGRDVAIERPTPGGRFSLRTQNLDDLTIDKWRTEPRRRMLDIEVEDARDGSPPLWKDIAYASVLALLLWAVAAVLLI